MNWRIMRDGGTALRRPVTQLKSAGAFSFSLASVFTSLDSMGGRI